MNVQLVWSALAALDGGTASAALKRPDASAAGPTDEDRELIENLELLQNLDSAADLELLRDLSLER